MKTLCYILFFVCNWLGWGPLVIVDGLVATCTFNFFRAHLGIRCSIWAWEHFRRLFPSK